MMFWILPTAMIKKKRTKRKTNKKNIVRTIFQTLVYFYRVNTDKHFYLYLFLDLIQAIHSICAIFIFVHCAIIFHFLLFYGILQLDFIYMEQRIQVFFFWIILEFFLSEAICHPFALMFDGWIPSKNCQTFWFPLPIGFKSGHFFFMWTLADKSNQYQLSIVLVKSLSWLFYVSLYTWVKLLHQWS